MPETDANNLLWGKRALEYAQKIALLATIPSQDEDDPVNQKAPGLLPGRGSATLAENKAAEIVLQQLIKFGILDVESHNFQGLRSIWLFIAQSFGFILAGHGAYWLLTRPTGAMPAVGISAVLFALGGYLLWCKFTFRTTPLQESLPHGTSQNVLAALHPTGEVRQRLVLISHLDSHRAVFWYANDLSLLIYRLGVWLGIYGILAAPLCYFLAGITSLPFFAYLGGVFAIAHFTAWLTGMTADLGPYSPGANNNASGVGCLLTLAERIHSEPLKHTEVHLAFTGCEATGCVGLLELLHMHGESLKDALWLDLEMNGIGDHLVYLNREGMLRKRHIVPVIETALNQAADQAGIPLETLDAGSLEFFTEAGALWEHGYVAACLVSMPAGKPSLPEYRRPSDTLDRLDPAALDRSHRLVWQLIQNLDKLT